MKEIVDGIMKKTPINNKENGAGIKQYSPLKRKKETIKLDSKIIVKILFIFIKPKAVSFIAK